MCQVSGLSSGAAVNSWCLPASGCVCVCDLFGITSGGCGYHGAGKNLSVRLPHLLITECLFILLRLFNLLSAMLLSFSCSSLSGLESSVVTLASQAQLTLSEEGIWRGKKTFWLGHLGCMGQNQGLARKFCPLLMCVGFDRVQHCSSSTGRRRSAAGRCLAGAVGSSAAQRCGRQMPGVCLCYCILRITLLQTSWCPVCSGNLFSPLPLLPCPPWRKNFI